MNRTVHLPPAPLEPAPLNMRWPLGLPLDLQVSFKSYKGEKLDVTDYQSQMVLFPRSRGGQHPYDMRVYDGVNGIIEVSIPGNDLIDESGYNFEIYSRVPSEIEGNPPIPTALPVKGVIVTYGHAYSSTGPLSPVSLPVVEGPQGDKGETGAQGPAGATGDPGQRGTMWFTGTGDPTLTEPLIPNDMYLDTLTGNIWKWTGTETGWMRA